MKYFNMYLFTTLALVTASITADNVMTITSESQFNKEIIDSKKPAVVKFSTQSCPACVRAQKPFHKLSQEMPNVVFAAIDAGQVMGLAQKYNIQSVPAFLYFSNGKLVDTKVGFSENFDNEVRGIFSKITPAQEESVALETKQEEIIQEPALDQERLEIEEEQLMPAPTAAAQIKQQEESEMPEPAVATQEVKPEVKGMACPALPAENEGFFNRFYNQTRDFFTSVGQTVRGWFK